VSLYILRTNDRLALGFDTTNTNMDPRRPHNARRFLQGVDNGEGSSSTNRNIDAQNPVTGQAPTLNRRLPHITDLDALASVETMERFAPDRPESILPPPAEPVKDVQVVFLVQPPEKIQANTPFPKPVRIAMRTCRATYDPMALVSLYSAAGDIASGLRGTTGV